MQKQIYFFNYQGGFNLMKKSKNTVKNKLIATLILGLTIAGSITSSNVSAMFSNKTKRARLSITNPDEQEFNEIPVEGRISEHDSTRDRYPNIGSVGKQNSKRDMTSGKGEYVTKEDSVINASKIIKETIDGKKFSIIATQAPKQTTISSFWDLIFSSKHVKDIVVLGNPWPETNPDIPSEAIQDYWSSKAILASSKYEITRNKETEVAPVYAMRYGGAKPISDSANKTVVTITNRLTGESKTVNVYNYHAWPDHGLPTETSDFDNFVSMFKDKRKLVVHCSAGVGRTGTFSACLEVLRRGAETADIRDIVTEMRTHRTLMVQNLDQYLFVKEYQKRHTPDDSIQDSPKPVDRIIGQRPLCDSRHPLWDSRHPLWDSRHPLCDSRHPYLDTVYSIQDSPRPVHRRIVQRPSCSSTQPYLGNFIVFETLQDQFIEE